MEMVRSNEVVVVSVAGSAYALKKIKTPPQVIHG